MSPNPAPISNNSLGTHLDSTHPKNLDAKLIKTTGANLKKPFECLGQDSPTLKLCYLRFQLVTFLSKTLLEEKNVRVELDESQPRLIDKFILIVIIRRYLVNFLGHYTIFS